MVCVMLHSSKSLLHKHVEVQLSLNSGMKIRKIFIDPLSQPSPHVKNLIYQESLKAKCQTTRGSNHFHDNLTKWLYLNIISDAELISQTTHSVLSVSSVKR